MKAIINHPPKLIRTEIHETYLDCIGEEDFTLRIYFVTDYILRFRYAIDGFFEKDFSYAIDPDFVSPIVAFEIEKTFASIKIKTPSVVCEVAIENFAISISNHEGKLINADKEGFYWESNEQYGSCNIGVSKRLQEKEAYYGLGDKPTNLNLKKGRFENWGTDAFAYEKGADPLYKNIPFYYGLHHGIGYGIFLDNSFLTFFDFDKGLSDQMSFGAAGGEMNYYFIAGPNLMDVCRRYTQLTGTPDMPPFWSLGYQQCKWSYYPESQVREICTKMRALEIPCDAIYLDIDYMDGYRCFTWDKEKFSDPKKMVSDFQTDGFKTVVIIDPGIKKDRDYWVFQEGLEGDHFCRRLDGQYMEGKVWPGDCFFPDFTKAAVRDWWGDLYRELIEDIGVAGVWNDMNEPALFEVESKTFPDDVIFDYDGHPTGHRKAHNVYGMQMARATAQGVKKYCKGKRSLIITRSGYAGLQRYSSVWTGDNIATWEHLWVADVQCQRLAISGVSFCGSDIGGFVEQPSGELMIRWISLGIFHPFCRVHSSGHHGDQEPWSFGEEYTHLFKQFVELRYRLLPYIYTSFYQYYQEKTPMLRPLVFVDQEDENTIQRDHEFLCGDHLLVCPVVEVNVSNRNVYLPKGKWFSYWNQTSYEGGQIYNIDCPLNEIPLLVKAGAIIPHYPIQQYVGEKEIEEVDLYIYYKEGEELSYYYEDNKEGYAYEKGEYRYATFKLKGTANKIIITQSCEGNYLPEFKDYVLHIIGCPFKINQAIIDGENKAINESVSLKIPSNFERLELL